MHSIVDVNKMKGHVSLVDVVREGERRDQSVLTAGIFLHRVGKGVRYKLHGVSQGRNDGR